MDWVEWGLNGARDLALVAVGGGMAWLSGLSASQRTERFDREKRDATDAAERKQAVQREARTALSVVYELELLVGKSKSDDPHNEFRAPADVSRQLRSIADVIPDSTVRASIDNFVAIINSWQLLIDWTDAARHLDSDPHRYQLRVLGHLRDVLAAAARGETPAKDGAAHLETLALFKIAALDAYWAQQAEDYEYFKTGRN